MDQQSRFVMVMLARLSGKTASVFLQTLFCIETCCYSERLTGMGVLPWFVTIELVLGSLVVMSVNPLTIHGKEKVGFVERADLLNRPLRTRMVGGVGAGC